MSRRLSGLGLIRLLDVPDSEFLQGRRPNSAPIAGDHGGKGAIF